MTPGTRGHFRSRDETTAAAPALPSEGSAEMTFRTLMNDPCYVVSFASCAG